MKLSIPFIQDMRTYNREKLRGDALAGLTVGVMLIPQGMAYAMIAGLPPIYGLYAATIPIFVYSLLGTSRQLAVGPVAMVSLLTAAGIGSLVEIGTAEYIALAVMLALMVGIIQFSLGIFKMGFLVNFLAHPVISGFTSAAALIIGFSQLKHLLGIDIPRSHHVHEILLHAIRQIDKVHIPTVIIGAAGIGLILLAKKIHKSIPGPLIALLFGIASVVLWQMDDKGMKIVGSIPSGLPSLRWPSFTWDSIRALMPSALAISLVGFMESIAVAKAIHAKHKDYQLVPNQELVALGLANIAGTFIQSFPVTGGFSRTAVKDQAGAKTGLAGMIAALVIVLTLLFFTTFFYFLPKAILASVIMVAVFGLIDWKEAKYLWRSDRSDFVLLAVTFFATLSLGIEAGIGVGVLLSVGLILYRSSRPHVAVLGKIPNTNVYRNVDRFSNVIVDDQILIVRFDAQLYFANATFFSEKLAELISHKGPQLKCIVIDASSINRLDSSAIHSLQDVIAEWREKGISCLWAGVKGPVRDALERTNLVSVIGWNHFFLTVEDAVRSIHEELPQQEKIRADRYHFNHFDHVEPEVTQVTHQKPETP